MRAADRESPPNSKKSSLGATASSPRTSAQMAATSVSTLVHGVRVQSALAAGSARSSSGAGTPSISDMYSCLPARVADQGVRQAMAGPGKEGARSSVGPKHLAMRTRLGTGGESDAMLRVHPNPPLSALHESAPILGAARPERAYQAIPLKSFTILALANDSPVGAKGRFDYKNPPCH